MQAVVHAGGKQTGAITGLTGALLAKQLSRTAPRTVGGAIVARGRQPEQRREEGLATPALNEAARDVSEAEEVKQYQLRADNRAWRLGSAPSRRSSGIARLLLGAPSAPYSATPAPPREGARPPSRLQDEFVLQELLGAGGFGVVCAATSRLDRARYAVKAVSLPSARAREAALQEAEAMAALPSHEGLVR
jgi:hypothetical protein